MRHKRWGFTKCRQWIWSPALKISGKVENLQKIDFQIIVSGVPQSVQKWFRTHLGFPKYLTKDFKIKKPGAGNFCSVHFHALSAEMEYFCSYFCLVAQNEAPDDVLLLKMKTRPYFLLKIFLQTLRSIYFRKNKTSIPKKFTLLCATSARTSPRLSHGFGIWPRISHEKSKISKKSIFKLLNQECSKTFRSGL